MNNLLVKLFPQGQRKLIVSLIALVVGIVLEKFSKTGLTDNMQQSLIAIVAIFTGGNVMEHLANALKVVKGTKVGQVIEDLMPGDQGLGYDKTPPAPEQSEEADPFEERILMLEDIQKRQARNIEVLVQQLNRVLQPQQPPQQPPYKG